MLIVKKLRYIYTNGQSLVLGYSLTHIKTEWTKLKSATSKIVGNRSTLWFYCLTISTLIVQCPLPFASDYVMACGPYPEGIWNVITHSTRCAPWITWGFANALFHVMWVGALFFCQCYQVWLQMSLCIRFYEHWFKTFLKDHTHVSSNHSKKVSNSFSHIYFVKSFVNDFLPEDGYFG